MRRLSAMMPFVVLTLATTLFEVKPSQGQQQATGREIPSVRLQGSGISFPAPLYETWFKRFSAMHRGVRVDYQAVGSGAGVKDFTNELVDFGASDAAITPSEMERVERGVQPIPMTAGAIVLVHSVPGVDELRLSREAYSAIFLGECTRWDDPRITRTNPGVEIPDLPIMVVVRTDGSGTTYVFTKHLAAVSEEFSETVGSGKTVRLARRRIPGTKERWRRGRRKGYERLNRIRGIRLRTRRGA